MTKAIFSAGLRTAFGRAKKGAFAATRPDDLLVKLIHSHREKYGTLYESQWEDLQVGCAYPHGEQGFNLGRMVALGSGLAIPAATTTRLCGSSLETVANASARIRAGWAKRILVGGVESLSRVERRGADFQESELIRLNSKHAYIQMGETAEVVADRYSIARSEQEEFAARSHELADSAYGSGFYKEQIASELLAKDEGIRVPVDREKMATLKPSFRENGQVTAATSSPLSDGACLGAVFSESQWKDSGLEDGLEIMDATWAHVEPEVMGIGPVPAIRSLLERNSLLPDQVAAIELNEAFAVQSLACVKELGLSLEKVNAKGGAIAIGHPLGASGLRLLITLQHRLQVEGKTGAYGVASLCIGGGQGMALLCRYIAR